MKLNKIKKEIYKTLEVISKRTNDNWNPMSDETIITLEKNLYQLRKCKTEVDFIKNRGKEYNENKLYKKHNCLSYRDYRITVEKGYKELSENFLFYKMIIIGRNVKKSSKIYESIGSSFEEMHRYRYKYIHWYEKYNDKNIHDIGRNYLKVEFIDDFVATLILNRLKKSIELLINEKNINKLKVLYPLIKELVDTIYKKEKLSATMAECFIKDI